MRIIASLLLITLIFSFSITAFSQDKDLAKKLKSEYKDAECASLEAVTTIDFLLNKRTFKPYIIKKDLFKLIALNDRCGLLYNATYDENSEVDPNYIARDSKKKDLYGVQKVCGNYEVNSIFYSDAKVCTYKIPLGSFGDINEFGVNTQYNDVKYFTKVFFHESFPAKERIIIVKIPAWMDVQLLEVNFEGYKIEKTVVPDPKTNINKHTYKVINLKFFDNENYTKGVCHRYPHLLVLSKSYTANKQTKTILNSPNDLYTWYYGLVKEVDNQSEVLKDEVKRLTEGKTDDMDKIKSIYYWVQDNIRYIAFENGIAGYKPESASKVYSKKYGDCKGMANLTKEMLKLAGFDARLTWIGTNNLPYSCQIPSLAINDHMICTVILNEKKLILDPTEKFCALGDYAERIQGKDIMIENGDTFIEYKVPTFSKERNLTTIATSITIQGNTLIGKANMILKGEAKKNLLYEANMTSSKDQDKLLKYIASLGGDKNLTVENVTTSKLNEREVDLTVDYTFKLDNYVSSFNNEIYVDIDPFKQYRLFNIDSSRIHDVSLGKKIYIKDAYRLTIPEEYVLKLLPKGMSRTNPDMSMSISWKRENNVIVMEKIISIDKGIILKENFKVWNSMVKDLVNAYNEQIVFTKK